MRSAESSRFFGEERHDSQSLIVGVRSTGFEQSLP